MIEHLHKHRFMVALCATLLAVGLTHSASAAPIDPGYDLFQTPPGGGVLDLTDLGGGIVPMVGLPVGPGNTGTIVQRTTGLPDLGTGIIDAQIVALSLVSINPVPLDFGGGPQLWDVSVGLDPSNASEGQINVLTHDPTGGTFDSFFDIFAIVSFDEVGGTTHVESPIHDQITSAGSPWSHTPGPGSPEHPHYPGGGFYPGPIMHTGPHPPTPIRPRPSQLPCCCSCLVPWVYSAWCADANAGPPI